MSAISLYLHIPFCVRKCNYCAFYSLPGVEEDTKDKYLQALMRQADSFPEHRQVKSVYFGGGTPSLFGAARLCQMLDYLRTRFHICEDAEITLEVNPGTVDPTFFAEVKKAGFNRLSVGMQSASNDELAFLGRIHTAEDVRACIEDARQAGFDNISLDLIFALPGQSNETFADSLRYAFSLRPEHLSVYSLQLEEGTPFHARRGELTFPTEEQEESQYDLLCSMAREAGYEHYEISSFAKDGHYSRHNLHYWQRGEYLGFGPGAHSHWNGKRFSNLPDLCGYLADPLGCNDYKKAERIDETEMWEEDVLLGLRTSFGIPAHTVPAAPVERMIALGLMGRRGENVFLTERGWRVSNAVIGQLLL